MKWILFILSIIIFVSLLSLYQSFIILEISRYFSIGFISQFTIFQIFAILCLINIINYKHKDKETKPFTGQVQMAIKDLTEKFINLSVGWLIIYVISLIIL